MEDGDNELYTIAELHDKMKQLLVDSELFENFAVEAFIVSVLLLFRLLVSIFSTLSCFLPFSLIPHMTILSKTHLAYCCFSATEENPLFSS